jgi:hypothetical protein
VPCAALLAEPESFGFFGRGVCQHFFVTWVWFRYVISVVGVDVRVYWRWLLPIKPVRCAFQLVSVFIYWGRLLLIEPTHVLVVHLGVFIGFRGIVLTLIVSLIVRHL